MIISYAQNLEDIILNRIFKDVENGFYVDVGACDPLYDSVTKLFYDKGWKGINIEPVPEAKKLFDLHRPRDINLNCAVGQTNCTLPLVIPESAAESTLNSSYQGQLKSHYHQSKEVSVPVTTLTNIWRKHVKNQNVNFLKIDVEGFEKEVLLGCDFNIVTPDILIIEATIPNTPVLCSHEWDYMLRSNYKFIYFDGLNNFYVRVNSSLEINGVTPPNPFDNFIHYKEQKAAEDIATLTAQINTLERSQHEASIALSDAYQTIERKNAELKQLQRLVSSNVSSFKETEFDKSMANNTCIFTIVSNNYLHYANTLFESLREHCPDAKLTLGLCDKRSPDIDYGDIDIIELDALPIKHLDRFIYQYNILELNTAIKPYVIEILMERGFDNVIYFDPDIKIYSSLDPMLSLLNVHNVLLTPHLTAPLEDEKLPSEQSILQAGSYNLGYIGLSVTPESKRLVKWWQGKLYKDCVVDLPNGLFVDQKWMDMAPSLFDGVHICKDAGWNVAYWNLAHRNIEKKSESQFYVNDSPLMFFHYSGYSIEAKTLSKHQNRYLKTSKGAELVELCDIYNKALKRNGIDRYKSVPFAFSKFCDGVNVPPFATTIIREDSFFEQIDFWNVDSVQNVHEYFNSPVFSHATATSVKKITKLFYAIWNNRADLKNAFPDIEGKDTLRFLDWLNHSAKTELQLDDIYCTALASSPSNDITNTMENADGFFSPVFRYLWTKRELLPLSLRLKLGKGVADWAFNLAYSGLPADTSQPTLEKGVNLVGYLNAESGIGEAARSSLRGLKKANIPFTLTDYRVGNVSRMDEILDINESQSTKRNVNLIHVNADQMHVVYESLGSSLFEQRYNIGYWYWEMPELPSQFDDAFAFVDEVWVATEYVKTAISQRTNKPVTLIPPNVNVDSNVTGKREQFNIKEDSFAFFHMSDVLSMPERKNPLGVIQAFKTAFGEEPTKNVQLILKISNTSRQPEIAETIKKAIDDDPRIKLIEGYLTREEINALISCVDAYVSLHRAEGFGLPIAEAMGYGKVAIATNWSGNVDFMNSENALPVDYELITLNEDIGPYEKGQKWAEPCIDDAANKMKRIAEDKVLATKLGKKAEQTIKSAYSPTSSGNAMSKRLVQLQKI